MSVRVNRVALVVEMVQKDMSVNRLAELAGVSRNTVTAVKCGKSCAMATAEKLARGLGVPVKDIIMEEG